MKKIIATLLLVVGMMFSAGISGGNAVKELDYVYLDGPSMFDGAVVNHLYYELRMKPGYQSSFTFDEREDTPLPTYGPPYLLAGHNAELEFDYNVNGFYLNTTPPNMNYTPLVKIKRRCKIYKYDVNPHTSPYYMAGTIKEVTNYNSGGSK